MKKGKRVMKITTMSKKVALLVLSVALILSVSVGGTLAYLIRGTDSKTNVFIPGEVSTSTEETFKDNVKTDVHVTNNGTKNDGGLPVYVRAKVVFNWIDKDGNVMSEPVNMESLEIDWVGENGNSDWVKHEGYFYYQTVLQPGASTSQLITRCAPKNGVGPLDARLQVTILTQTLQADANKTAVETSWGKAAESYVPDFPAEQPTI